MTWFRKGECSRLSAQHKKMTFDQASVCVQREYREWKYQKMSEVGGLAYRFSGVQSSSQEQSSWGNYNREKRVLLYPWINGQPMKRCKMRRNVVRFTTRSRAAHTFRVASLSKIRMVSFAIFLDACTHISEMGWGLGWGVVGKAYLPTLLWGAMFSYAFFLLYIIWPNATK